MSRMEHLPEFAAPADHGLLRFLTCGSVDDGKSTLIGRLLHDSKAILADTLHAIARSSQKRGLEDIDLSLLTDGLQAEREQGITIDVAYRYFSTGTRKYIIADTPGHEQYTRNMVTAASTADLAIILVDARRGMLTQTRRHSCIAHLLGIPRLVVAVNKMDLVGYDQAVFERIRADYLHFAARLGIDADGIDFIPLSALRGDQVVERGEALPWYAGPTLLELLEAAPGRHAGRAGRGEALRFPVQYVCRPQASADPALHDFRAFMGRVESGTIAVGDAVAILPAGRRSRVKEIRIGDRSLPRAVADQSVSLLLEDEIDISRGDLIVAADHDDGPRVARQLEATLCWLAETPLDPRRKYLLRQTTREARAIVAAIAHRVDMNTLAEEPAATLAMNDIASISLRLARPLCVDAYAANRATGAFILIDEASNATVGAGMINAAS